MALAFNYRFVLLALMVVSALLSVASTVEAKSSKHCRSTSSHKNLHKANKRPAHHHRKGSHKASHTTSAAAHKPTPVHDDETSDDTSTSTSSASTPASFSIKVAGFTPKHGKAGTAGGQSLKWTSSSLGWFYDWTPNPVNSNSGDITTVPMLWGLGRLDHDDDVARFQAFQKVVPGSAPFVMGFNEPDFKGQGSSGVMTTSEAADAWEKYIAPHGKAGAKLISPSMAMQKDEKWLAPFIQAVDTKPDIIAVHIFQDNMDGVKGVLDHFATYGKPMWITEFACINYQGPAPVYCDQDKTDSMIASMIELFQGDDRVAAYSYSDAYNGPNSPLTPNHDMKSLSTTGQAFLDAVKAVKSRID